MTNTNILLSSYSIEQLETLFRDCLKTELQSFRPSTSSPTDDFITENEAKKILLVSKVTLKKWRDEGRIKYYRIGSRIRYKKSDLFKSLETVKLNGRGLR